MKKSSLICFKILFLLNLWFSNALLANDVITRVEINVMPGNSENIIDSQNDDQIPVIIFGSSQLDVTKIDLFSLTLGVHFYWPQSYVKLAPNNVAQCEIVDSGSYSTHYFDNLGPVDGYNDLLCQFGSDFAMIQTGAQRLTLAGAINDGFALYETLIVGTDSAEPAVESNDIARCCIRCEQDGECEGCNGDVYQCDKYLRVCESEELCKDCSRCLPPKIS